MSLYQYFDQGKTLKQSVGSDLHLRLCHFQLFDIVVGAVVVAAVGIETLTVIE